MTCIFRTHHECGCSSGNCVEAQRREKSRKITQSNSNANMWLAIGIAISLCTVIFSIGYLALERAERQYQLEARV